MTNAEKFEEIFGFEPSREGCPVMLLKNCSSCKGFRNHPDCYTSDWWNSEYKEEVPEVETKGCFNCKYSKNELTKEPCLRCSAYLDRWEETENGKS